MDRFAWIGLACLMTSCAHYGWADRGVAESSCNVHTVGVPPESRVDESALTAVLVEDLRTRGIDARWGKEASNVLECQVSFDDFFAGSSEFISKASVECLLGEATLSHSATSRATLTGRDSTRARETVRLDAATQARQKAVPGVVQRLKNTPESS